MSKCGFSFDDIFQPIYKTELKTWKMSLFQFKKINKADIPSKYSVFGYMRQMESALKLPTIPSLILHTCLLFYYIPGYLANANRDFKISSDKLSVERIGGRDYNQWMHTIYCNKWISSISKTISQRKFEITKQTSVTDFYFGIVSTDNCLYRDFSNADDATNYAFGNNYMGAGGIIGSLSWLYTLCQWRYSSFSDIQLGMLFQTRWYIDIYIGFISR